MTTAISSITLDQLAGETVWLRRLAGSLVPNDADDVVQETLIVASERAPADRPLRPWLARVLVNRVRMLARSGGRRRKREEAVGKLATEPARPDEIADRIKLHRQLADYVLELAQPERDVVLLHYFEGLTSIEIGNRLGVSAGTVRWRLKQAVDELRARLDAESPNRAWLAPMLALAKGSGTATTSVSAFVLAALAAIAIIVALLALPKASPASASASPTDELAPAVVGEAHASRGSAPEAPAGGAAPVLDLDQQRVVGRVLDLDGKPVAGANVEVQCYMESDRPSKRTGVDGSFSFDIDRSCEYWLFATTPDAAAWTTTWRHWGDAIVEMTLQPMPSAMVHVVDAKSGLPLAGANVSSYSGWVDRATTDSKGDARLRWTTPGTTIEAALSGYLTTSTRLAAVDGDHTLELGRGIAVSGVVFDPDAQPSSCARALLYGPIDRGQWHLYRASTDVAGGFTVALPGPGRYRFGASAPQLGNAVFHEIDVGADGRTDLVADLVRLSEITGTVVDAAGKPVANARVRMVNESRRPVITDGHGRFTLRDAPDETVVIAHKGQDASLAQLVTLKHSQHAELELRLGPAGVTGVVVDADGSPIPHAQVFLNPCCAEAGPIVVPLATTFTDDHGRFALDTPRGELRLSVRRSTDDDFLDDDDVHLQGGARDVRLVLP